MTLEPGQAIAHYRLVEKIGEGGMGIIWKALDTKLNRHVALKMLPPDLTSDQERLLRFKREAQAAAALDHPGIAVIYEVGDLADSPYIAMQLLEGRTLQEVMGGRPLPLREWLRLMLPIAEGLAHAHRNGIVHRDLKPGNVIVTNDGHVKILDFGLAKVLDTGRSNVAPDAGLESRLQTISRELTQRGKVVGTVAYMSPEQARGRPVDQRSDIFSFGVMLYQMVTGRLPFRGESDVESLSATLSSEPQSPSRLVADLPADAERIIRKSLEKDPANRYQHADDLAIDLRNLKRDLDSGRATMPSGITSGAATMPGAAVPGVRRRWMMIGAALVVALLAAIGWMRLRPRGDASVVPPMVGAGSGPAADGQSRKRIVVLPFQNLGSSEDEYFAAGITEEVISRLATLDGLGVISRGSAFQYDRAGKSMQQIGEDFDVDYILDGTVRWAQSSGGTSRVRITPQLIQAGDDTQVWSDSFDEVIDDIFAIQSEIAGKVAGQLGIALGGSSTTQEFDRPPTANAAAYQAYLRGRHHSAWGLDSSAESFNTAIQMFERAIELDPGFVLAYCWLSRQHSAMVHWGHDRSDGRREMALAAARQALALAPNNPDAHLAMGYYHYWARRDYEPALREFDLALAGMPNNSELYESIAYVQRRQGRLEPALNNLRKAATLDPLNHRLFSSIAETLCYLRRYDESIPAADQAIALGPDSTTAYWTRATALILNGGSVSEALRSLEESPNLLHDPAGFFVKHQLLTLDDKHDEALELVRSRPEEYLSEVGTLRPLALLGAWSLQRLGRLDEARSSYERARATCERLLEQSPDDFRLHASLGLALAGLGEKAAAVEAGRRATELYPISADALAASEPLNDLAFIYAQVGNYDAALDQIETLLTIPSQFSVVLLQRDPAWNALRDLPRYREIVRRYGR